MATERVRVTYKELESRAGKLHQTKQDEVKGAIQGSMKMDTKHESANHRLESSAKQRKYRKPDQAIYRPGSFKQGPKSPDDETEPNENNDENSQEKKSHSNDDWKAPEKRTEKNKNDVPLRESNKSEERSQVNVRRFGPRKQTSPAQVKTSNRISEKVSPEKPVLNDGRKFGPMARNARKGVGKSQSRVAMQEEEETDELMLDEPSAISPQKRDLKSKSSTTKTSQPIKTENVYLNPNSELRRPHGKRPEMVVKSRVKMDVNQQESYSARKMSSVKKGRKEKDNEEAVIDISPLQINQHQTSSEDNSDFLSNRKVNLGGNMRITCTFNTKDHPLDTQDFDVVNHIAAEEEAAAEIEKYSLHIMNQRGTGKQVSLDSRNQKSVRSKENPVSIKGQTYIKQHHPGKENSRENVLLPDEDFLTAEEHDWDLDMEKQDYHLETMVISSSSRHKSPAAEEAIPWRSVASQGKDTSRGGKSVDNKGDRLKAQRDTSSKRNLNDSYPNNFEYYPETNEDLDESRTRKGRTKGVHNNFRQDDAKLPYEDEEPKPQRKQRQTWNERQGKESSSVLDEVLKKEAWMDKEDYRTPRRYRQDSGSDMRSDDDRGYKNRGRDDYGYRAERRRRSSEREDSRGMEENHLDRESRYNRDHLSRTERLRRDSGRSSEGSLSDGVERTDSKNSKGGGLIHIPQKSASIEIPKKKELNLEYSPDSTKSPKWNQLAEQYNQIYQSPESSSPSLKHSPKPKKDTKQQLHHVPDKKRLWDPSNPNQRPALEEKESKLVFHDPEAPEKSPTNQNAAYDKASLAYAAPYQHPYYPIPSYAPLPNQVWNKQYIPQGTQEGLPTMPYLPSSYSNYPPQGMSFDPQQVGAMQARHGNQQAAMQVVMQAADKETEYSSFIVHAVQNNESLDFILKIRQDLEKLYEAIILLDLEIANQYNIEQLLWKNAYYQLCELLRKHEDPTGFFKEAFLKLLEKGCTFYEDLLTKLQSTYSFKLDTKTGLDPLHEEPRRSIKLAILSAQRCMIALGDIARYRELAHGTNNYGKARSWYSKAQHLAPRNGRPYNQLAILALYTRRKLDAVYYYMRSLGASNPFLSARESLMTIFEEVRKKVEHKEQLVLKAKKDKEQVEVQKLRRISNQRRGAYEANSARKEIWIHYDGSSSNTKLDEFGEEEEKVDATDMEQENLRKMPPAELNKRFVLSFLNVHGKLFTKIGMEAFSHAVENLLMEFRALLSQTPTPINSTRLLQLMAINMFAVDKNELKDEKTDCDDMRPYLQELAIQLGLDMFAILAGRCTKQLGDIMVDENSMQQCLTEDLHEILPAVKVFADWMMCHPSLWNPPPNLSEEHLVSKVDVWDIIADLLNIIKDFDDMGIDFISESEEAQEILLPEDLMLSGFVPLQALPLKPLYVSKDTDKILAMDSVRIISLKLFGEFIYGQETPIITFSVSHNRYISIAPKLTRESSEGSGAKLPESVQENDDVIVEEVTWEDSDGEVEDNHVSHLKERRNSLERQLREQQHNEKKIQAVIERQRTQRDLVLEIYPVYLVPDTNCFIDHLPYIERLLASQRYLIIVPLVVINELDGLQRGLLGGHAMDPNHVLRVQHCAREAIFFLEQQFGERNKNLKALTSKGTVLETIAFRSEESDRSGNNDDLILKCCIHYCDDKPQNFMPAEKNAPIKLYRDVVLLTSDRNLRVKAIQQNVPTKDILVYVKWAKV